MKRILFIVLALFTLQPIALAMDFDYQRHLNTQLIEAIEKSYNLNRLQELINQGANPNAQNEDGEYAIVLAARKDRPSQCDLLLDAGADISGYPIHLLQIKTKTQVNNYGWGLRPEEAIKRDKAALGLLLVKVIQRNQYEAAKRLIAAGAYGSWKKDCRHLHLNHYIPEKTCDCHPLIIAAKEGYSDICELLIARGANVDTRNCWNHTALFQAAWEGHEEIVSQLLDAKAQVIPIHKDQPPLGLTAKEVISNLQLMKATFKGDQKEVEQLICAGASVNPQYKHTLHKNNDRCFCFPLIVAAKKGFTDICELLITHGADVNAQNCLGTTALHEAAYEGHQDIVRLLFDRKANVNEQDRHGYTPLMLAAQMGKLDIVNNLLRANVHFFTRAHGKWVESATALTLLASATMHERSDTVHPLCDLLIQKMFARPSQSQIKRIITLFCCLKKAGGYPDIFKLLKAPLLGVIAQENRENHESQTYQEIDRVSSFAGKDLLLKKYGAPKKTADGLCVLC